MPDFTISDTMAEIRYELDDREIYNDIRSKIGIITVETIVDSDPVYKWYIYTVARSIPAGWDYFYTFVRRHDSAENWQIVSHAATWSDFRFEDGEYRGGTHSYYDYTIGELKDIFVIRDGSNWTRAKYVDIKNTGDKTMFLTVKVKYKYLATEGTLHEETTFDKLTVRATDATSIAQYGRRVMNLTWTEGTLAADMQALVDHYLTRFKDPVARLIATIKGHNDILRTQIITREISDIITVINTNLGLNADCFINSISIRDDTAGIPICTWGLEIQRSYELLTLFLLGTSELDGSHVLGS